MSYATMDHAGWVERNIGPGRQKKPSRDKNGQVTGWHAAPNTLNRFQARVMDICGMVFGGIYNAPIAWKAVWWRDNHVGVPLVRGRTSLASHDFERLTRLVLCCMEARIRVEVSPRGFNSLELKFWQRSHEGNSSERHPDIGESVAEFQAYLPAGHRVRYRPELDDPLPAQRRRHLEYLAREGAKKWADEVITAISAGDEREAKWKGNLLARDLATASEYAERLGGGQNAQQLLTRIRAQHQRAAEARARMEEQEAEHGTCECCGQAIAEPAEDHFEDAMLCRPCEDAEKAAQDKEASTAARRDGGP